ncbi:cytochrome c oxidase subunit 2-like [Arachis duranensis]|uniref:Cytochrome c oxidase subunit 2 n=2 Tax=Arachis TaxID=3817 RepID=A0A6P4DHR5_ARADU|nr:cytochrome c oxidase subunit 2-like [Arachis duranensis]
MSEYSHSLLTRKAIESEKEVVVLTRLTLSADIGNCALLVDTKPAIKRGPQRIVHGTTIEILRIIFPSIIPMFIAIPSFALLYSMDEVVVDPAITIKAIGHQWYQTYEYSDYNSSDEQSLTFDSYTIPEDDLELGQSRLLEVDNRVVVPAKSRV